MGEGAVKEEEMEDIEEEDPFDDVDGEHTVECWILISSRNYVIYQWISSNNKKSRSDALLSLLEC